MGRILWNVLLVLFLLICMAILAGGYSSRGTVIGGTRLGADAGGVAQFHHGTATWTRIETAETTPWMGTYFVRGSEARKVEGFGLRAAEPAPPLPRTASYRVTTYTAPIWFLLL